MLKPLEADLLKETNPASQTKLYQRIWAIVAYMLEKYRELVLAMASSASASAPIPP